MLLNDVEQISDPSNHHVFMDNFFTSYDLLSDLRTFHFKATGTMRQNRTGGAAKLMSTDKEMKKSGRGSFDYRTDGHIFVTKWHDNSSVVVGSNHLTHEPLSTAKRRVKRDVADVPQPHMIKEYNRGKVRQIDLFSFVHIENSILSKSVIFYFHQAWEEWICWTGCCRHTDQQLSQKMVVVSFSQCPQYLGHRRVETALSSASKKQYDALAIQTKYHLVSFEIVCQSCANWRRTTRRLASRCSF